MSEFLTVPPARAPVEAGSSRTIETLATLLVFVLTVAILYIGREIFVPIAIAILLSFVLSPLCRILRHAGFHRTLAVWTVVLLTLVVAAGLSAILTRQVTELAGDAPKYQQIVLQKVDNLRQMLSSSPTLNKMFATIDGIGEMMPHARQPGGSEGGETARDALQSAHPRPSQAPVPVEIRQPMPGLLSIVQTVVGSALSPLATTAIVAIFTIFILLQREDLRDRFIRLVGSHDLQRTTVAMTDAAKRLSRYFLIQTLINAGFGAIVAGGLTFIGVPSPVLWGIVALFMRFVPYIGSFISALLPIALAAAVDPGWTMAIETAILFAVAEPIVGQVVEPMLYGHNTGISPIAVIVSATFWTWLWGPVGLVLSTPLTVCLVVLGRHADRLEFLDVIFGDAPALTPIESFYQRLLAGDASEIADQADSYLREHSLLDYYEDVALQAILLAQADVRRGALDTARQIRIRDTIAELIEDVADRVDAEPAPGAASAGEPYASLGSLRSGDAVPHHGGQPSARLAASDLPAAWIGVPVLCIGGRTALDEAAAALLAQILGKHGLPAVAVGADALGANAADTLPTPPDAIRLVCLSFLDADGAIAHARHAVRRVRRRLPGARIIGCYWTVQGDLGGIRALCADTRTDGCTASLPDALATCLDEARSASQERPDATAHVA